ncbi:MAG: two-component system, sensor histidine kinase [Desulfonauticus sp.]|jgi:signal transduction histidine kinase/CheY-like chemotaxis protein|nr:two-component system, sensor histidine kinase [Desulfonauticus sp.]
MKNKPKSLQVKFLSIFFIFFFSFVLLLSISLYLYNDLYNEYIKENIDSSTFYIDKILNNEAQNILEKTYQISKDNVLGVVLSLDLPFYGEKRLKELLKSSSIEHINILDINDNLVFSTSENENFRKYKLKKDVEFAFLNSKIYLSVKVPILHESMKRIGYLVSFSPLPGDSFLKELSQKNQLGLAVKWGDKFVVGSSWLNLDKLNSLKVSGVDEYRSWEKGFYLKPLSFKFSGANLDLFVIKRLDEFIQRFKNYAYISLISLILLGFIFFLAVFFLHKNVISPLSKLTLLAKRIELNEDIDWQKENEKFHLDEFGYLYQQVKKMVLALKEETQRVEKANKLKDNFLATISHEIRTPLNVILGLTQVLETKLKIPENQKYLSLIKNSANNLVLILNDLLDFSKLKAGSLELKNKTNNLSFILKNIAHTYQIQCENKNLEFIFDCNLADSFWVYCDKLRLEQVLNNLLSNALKFTSEGKIIFSSTVIKEEKDIAWVKFLIKDTGIGIPLEKQKDIFKLFIQVSTGLNREYSGTGLGLAIAWELVKKMGGEGIECKSIPDQGTEFSFILPFTLDVPKQKEEEKLSLKRTTKENYKILLADDSLDNRILMTEVFKILGQDNFIVVENGEEVLNLLQRDNHFDLIFLDIEMPKLNGLECTKKIRDLGVKVPIVIITGHVLEEIKEKAFQLGVNFFLTKPFDLKDIENIFKQVKKID